MREKSKEMDMEIHFKDAFRAFSKDDEGECLRWSRQVTLTAKNKRYKQEGGRKNIHTHTELLVVLRVLHFYLSGAEMHYLSKSAFEWGIANNWSNLHFLQYIKA